MQSFITIDFILSTLDESKISWNMEYVAQRSDVTIHIARKLFCLDRISMCGFSYNKNLTIDFVREYSPRPVWIWSGISRNLAISIPDIQRHPELPWDWDSISRRSDIFDHFDFVIANPLLSWNWMYLTIVAPMNIIMKYLTARWDMPNLHYNKGLTLKVVLALGAGLDPLFHFIPEDVLISENIYDINMTVQKYLAICRTPLREKYPSSNIRECSCEICKPVKSTMIKSYRDVIADPDHDWNWDKISSFHR